MVRLLLQIGFFLVLLTNSLTLRSQNLPFDIYTLDIALIPFAFLVAIRPLFLPGPRLRWSVLDLLFAALLLVIIASQLFSANRQVSLTTTVDWVRLVLIYFLGRFVLGGAVSERALVTSFTVMALLLVGHGFLQVMTGEPIGIIADYFGERQEQYGWHRVSGPTPNSNVFAAWVIIYGGLLLSVLLAKARPLAFFAIVGAIAVVMIGTLSRGGALGFVAIFVVLLFMHSRQTFSMSFFVPASMVSVGLMGFLFVMMVTDARPMLTRGVYNLVARHTEMHDFEEGGERLELLKLGLLLLKSPKVAAVGCGSGGILEAGLRNSSAGAAIVRDLVEQGAETGTSVHNVWIATAVENGIPSALILLSIFVLFVRHGSRMGLTREGLKIWSAYFTALGIWYLGVASQVYLSAARLPVLVPLVFLIAFVANRIPEAQAFGSAARADSDSRLPC